jgi:hypothetical protein
MKPIKVHLDFIIAQLEDDHEFTLWRRVTPWAGSNAKAIRALKQARALGAEYHTDLDGFAYDEETGNVRRVAKAIITIPGDYPT